METPFWARPVRCIMKCRKCKTAYQANVLFDNSNYHGELGQRCFPYAKCPACATVNYGKQVQGTYVPGKVCNKKCMSATGDKCECGCAGENHGGGHSWAA